MIASLRLWLVGALLVLATPALAERVALVLGNSAYRDVSALPNAARDASDMAARLRDIGFAVHSGIDLTRAETLQLLDDFAASLSPDDLALFYYAGHGAQIGAENYVLPVDVTARDQVGLTEAGIKLQTILRTMELRADRRIVILDACRNNPFVEELAARDLGGQVARGLARVEAGVGSYIAFSTQPGNVALDGTGQNSPFTAALLDHIGSPGDDIHAIMRRVRADVVAATNQTQVPWENSSLIDEVFLSGTSSPGAVQAPVATTGRPGAAPVDDRPLHYVGGLDPNGDGFLALREGTTSTARRLAKMTEGTVLEVLQTGDPWWQVRTPEGLVGYAHSNWIRCCVDAAPEPMPLAETASCDDLWYARNLIWDRYGYCFQTERAISVFGNENCNAGLQRGAIALADQDRDAVDRIAAEEARLGCN
jgi:hypothetical protein